MEFCSIQSADDDTIAGLMRVYPETMEELYQKNYEGRYDSEIEAHAAQTHEYTESIATFLAQEDRYMFAFRDGDAIAAALRIIHMGEDNWYLEALGTAPEYRGQGIAKKLIKQTLRLMRTIPARSIVSLVRRDNEASRAVHEACGFLDTGMTAKDEEGTSVDECMVYHYIY